MEKTEKEKLDELLAQTAEKAATKAVQDYQEKQGNVVDKTIGQFIMNANKASGDGITVGGRVEVPKAISAARWIKVAAMAEKHRTTFDDTLKAMYPDDGLISKLLTEQKAVNKALSATIPSEGGFTVPQVLASEIIMPLYTLIGVTKLGGRRVPLPNGNMTIPRINTAATVGWIGENSPSGVSQEVIGDVKLNAKKLGVIVPVSNDLLRSADIAADQWVLDDIRNQMFVEMDRAMLYGSNTAFQPPGLATLLPSGQIQGSSSTAFTTTLISTLYGKIRQANVTMISPGIIINAGTEAYLMNLTTTTGAFLFYAEMVERGTIRGIPYAVSNNAKYTTSSTDFVDFFIGDWSEFIVGTQGDLMIETSRDGSYESGGTTYSALSRDQTIVRCLSLQDYAIRHSASFIQYTAKLATS